MAGTFPHGNQGILGAVPLQLARGEIALPAAGAFDANPGELNCMAFDHVTLFMTYTAGDDDGAFTIRPEFSPHASDTVDEDWFRGTLYDPDTVVPGSDALSQVQREDIQYTSTSTDPESFVFGPIAIAGGIQRMRISAAESGVVGTPGTLKIEAVFF